MRKVLVANYFTGTTDPDVDGSSYAFAAAEIADKDALVAKCRAELETRFEPDKALESWSIRVLDELDAGEPVTVIDLGFDDEVEDDGEDGWNRYFIIAEVDFL